MFREIDLIFHNQWDPLSLPYAKLIHDHLQIIVSIISDQKLDIVNQIFQHNWDRQTFESLK